MRVFIVEDHPDTLTSLISVVSKMGHQVSSAKSMQEALRILPTADYDILLSDVGLSDGNGWELLLKVRPYWTKPVFAIAMSGYSSAQDLDRSKTAGFGLHIVKPFEVAKLKEALQLAESELKAMEAKAVHALPQR